MRTTNIGLCVKIYRMSRFIFRVPPQKHTGKNFNSPESVYSYVRREFPSSNQRKMYSHWSEFIKYQSHVSIQAQRDWAFTNH